MKKAEPVSHETYPAMNKAMLLFGCPRGYFAIAMVSFFGILWAFQGTLTGIVWAAGSGIALWAAGIALHAYDPHGFGLACVTLMLNKYYDAGKRTQR